MFKERFVFKLVEIYSILYQKFFSIKIIQFSIC